MSTIRKADMANWNAFVASVLSGKMKRPNKKDNRVTSTYNLTFKKDSENLKREGVKNEQ